MTRPYIVRGFGFAGPRACAFFAFAAYRSDGVYCKRILVSIHR
jgi:hypothetical protein